MGNTILYDVKDHVATLTYNRPEALNAVNRELRRDVNAAWRRFRDDDDAWVGIITGTGKSFSAGADLKDPAGAVDNDEHSFWEVPSYQSLEGGLEIWKPTIAAVNGYAIGFGLTMVAACDFAIASDRATFGFPEVQLGVPTIQGSIRTPRKIAWHHAMELLLIGDLVDAERAKMMNLVWDVVPHDELMDAANALARRLMKGAPLAQRATKEVAHRGQELPFVDAVRFGETMRKVAGATDDAKEGGQAKRDRRDPTWRAT